MKLYRFLIIAVSFLIFSFDAVAQNSAVIVGGNVGNPFKITQENFSSFRQSSVKAKSKDGQEHQYSGINLYDILIKAEGVPGNVLRGKSLAKYILVSSAADGYQVVIALPEIDPEFTDNIILLANKMDGKDLLDHTGPFRLVVPFDKKQARSAMRVTNIDVLTAEKP